jgi:hypothetical protein
MNTDKQVLFLLILGNAKSELNERAAEPDIPASHKSDLIANKLTVKQLTAPHESRIAGAVAVNYCYMAGFGRPYVLAATDLKTNSIVALSIAPSLHDGLGRVLEELANLGIECRPHSIHFDKYFPLTNQMMKRCAEIGIDIVLNTRRRSNVALFACAAMWLHREFKRARRAGASEAEFLASVEEVIRQVNAWPKRLQKIRT